MTYAERIQKLAPKYDPRHVEAYLRLEYGTLDHLSPATFTKEVRIACQCIDADPDQAEQLARSFGLVQ